MNKTTAIANHLIEKKTITTWEAIKLYGATRLSAIIYNLRYKRGMDIRNETMYFTDRFGNKSHYDVYIYEPRGDEDVNG